MNDPDVNEVMAEHLADCEALLREAVAELLRASGSKVSDTAGRLSALRRGKVPAVLAGIVDASAHLQNKAVAKFGEGLWWCTERSLSQATPVIVARRKARWIGDGPVMDLCSGLGADTLALSERLCPGNVASFGVTAVDRDSLIIAMASENCRLNQVDDARQITFVCDDVVASPILASSVGDKWFHVDPDRRDDAGRKTRPEDYSPAWDVVQRQINGARGALIKLAPAAELPDTSASHRVWSSLSGSVREQTLVIGESLELAGRDLATDLLPGGRTALVLKRDESVASFSASEVISDCPRTEKPHECMVDPDAAIRAAGLTESFVVHHGLTALGGPAGFLTGDESVAEDPFAKSHLAVCEPLVWKGACDDRKLRKTLRSLDAYPVRVKARGVSQNPNELEKRYRECGDRPLTLWLGKAGRRQYAALTDPVSTA